MLNGLVMFFIKTKNKNFCTPLVTTLYLMFIWCNVGLADDYRGHLVLAPVEPKVIDDYCKNAAMVLPIIRSHEMLAMQCAMIPRLLQGARSSEARPLIQFEIKALSDQSQEFIEYSAFYLNVSSQWLRSGQIAEYLANFQRRFAGTGAQRLQDLDLKGRYFGRTFEDRTPIKKIPLHISRHRIDLAADGQNLTRSTIIDLYQVLRSRPDLYVISEVLTEQNGGYLDFQRIIALIPTIDGGSFVVAMGRGWLPLTPDHEHFADLEKDIFTLQMRNLRDGLSQELKSFKNL